MRKIREYLCSPRDFLLGLLGRPFCRAMNDKIYISLKYWAILGRWPNLDNPTYMSEKIQWLKLHDMDERYPRMVDKYAVREYVAKQIGEEFLVPLLGVWDTADDIEWEKLPKKFVLKCTHGSHTNIVCMDKSKLSEKSVKETLNIWLKNEDTFYYGREWPYKMVKPRIIAEEFIESESAGGITDYKFMCFHGEADHVMICSDRASGNVRFDHFSRDWKFLRYQYVDRDKPADYTIRKPEMMDEMFRIAEQLAKPFGFVRVDLYCEFGKVYFGELTFFPQSGFDTDYTPEADKYFGSKMNLNLQKVSESQWK